MLLWVPLGLCVVLAILLCLPMLFENEVLRSRSVSSKFRLKYFQHLYPDERVEIGKSFNQWIKYKDRGISLEPNSVGRRVRVIRELTGSDQRNHLDALALGGELVTDLAESGWIQIQDRYAWRVVSAGSILEVLIGRIDSQIVFEGSEEERDAQVRNWLSNNTIDIEQVVELLLAAIEVLQARIIDVD